MTGRKVRRSGRVAGPVPATYRTAANPVSSTRPRETVARALWLYVDHPELSVSTIAAEACVGVPQVRRWARQAGLPVRSVGHPGQRAPSAEQVRAACDAYEAEGSATAAGRFLGVSRNTVLRRLRAGGIDVAPRPAAIRERLAVAYDRGDGTMTVPRAAGLVGLHAETVRRRCASGRIPGARRDHDGPRGLWRVPTAWVDANRADGRPVQARTAAPDTYLPAPPLGEWIRARGAGGRSVDDLARSAGMSDGSRLRTILRGQQETIAMATADRLLTANDAHLRDVWPHLDDTDSRRTER